MDENRELERREYRRKRRIRNQIIAYAVVVLVLAGLVTGAVIGIRTLTKNLSEKKQAQELARQLEEASKEEEEAVVEPPEPVEPEPVAEEVDWLEEMVNTCIAEMPLEDKVAGLFCITPEALTGVGKAIQAGEGTRDALNKFAVGGLVYFDQNIVDREQLTQMLSNTVSMSKYPLFLAVDEEGGEVRRVGKSSIEVPEVGDMATLGATGDTMEAYNAGTTIASYLYELGFNLDFAPVADVVTEGEASAIGDRSFGAEPTAVGDMAAAVVGGLQDTGVSACLKHFPGIGSPAEDTHDGMVTTEKSLEDMKASDFIPFQAGMEAGVHFIMAGHVSAPEVTGDNTPASLSEKMIAEILRGELGYDGIVITDALNMSAVTEAYTSDQAAVMALKAGVDMLLMPEDFEAAYEGVLAAVSDGTLTEERIDESLRRIYRIKYRDRVDQGEEAGGTTGEDTAEAAGEGTQAGAEGAADEGAQEVVEEEMQEAE